MPFSALGINLMIFLTSFVVVWSSFLQLGNALMLNPGRHAMIWMENSIAESLLWLFGLGKAHVQLKSPVVLSLNFLLKPVLQGHSLITRVLVRVININGMKMFISLKKSLPPS